MRRSAVHQHHHAAHNTFNAVALPVNLGELLRCASGLVACLAQGPRRHDAVSDAVQHRSSRVAVPAPRSGKVGRNMNRLHRKITRRRISFLQPGGELGMPRQSIRCRQYAPRRWRCHLADDASGNSAMPGIVWRSWIHGSPDAKRLFARSAPPGPSLDAGQTCRRLSRDRHQAWQRGQCAGPQRMSPEAAARRR